MFNNYCEISEPEDILQGLISELGKYPLSCLNEHNKIVQNITNYRYHQLHKKICQIVI